MFFAVRPSPPLSSYQAKSAPSRAHTAYFVLISFLLIVFSHFQGHCALFKFDISYSEGHWSSPARLSLECNAGSLSPFWKKQVYTWISLLITFLIQTDITKQSSSFLQLSTSSFVPPPTSSPFPIQLSITFLHLHPMFLSHCPLSPLHMFPLYIPQRS